ncbi:MAG: hypothetical protein F4X99_12015 [Gammaproteobacteria bacterium]|nr:hypothetical protein [Gammaproteobacteria bacterium]
MRIKIDRVADRGDLARERLVLRVRKDADIGDFMLIRTGFRGRSVTTNVTNSLWFPYQEVAEGDLIVVYSKSGTNKRHARDSGGTVHFFYWGQRSPLWDTDDAAPVLLYAPEWKHRTPEQLHRSA